MLNKEYFESWVRELSDEALNKAVVFFAEELKESHIENSLQELEYKYDFCLMDQKAR